MMKMISTFAIVFAIFFFGIQAFRSLSGKEKWHISKLLAYSMTCAILSVIALIGFVIAF